MYNYSSEKDLNIVSKLIAKRFTLAKYKSFLIENKFISRDALDEPLGIFAKTMVKEEYVKETLLFMGNEIFLDLIHILFGENEPSKVDTKSSISKTLAEDIKGLKPSSVNSATRKLKVFLCHASQDKVIVSELYQKLLAEGWIEPWLDKENILPGQDWELEIEQSVKSADVVIICLSKSSIVKEGYYQKEIVKILDVADEKPEGTIFIIPLRLDDCEVPRRLAKWQYVDYFPKENIDNSFIKLIQSLTSRSKSLEIDIKSFISKSSLPKTQLDSSSINAQPLELNKKNDTEIKVDTLIQKKKVIVYSHKSDRHSALLSEKISQASGAGVKFVTAKLQWGKDDFGYSLHAEPSSFSSYGMQTTDFLNYLGFRRESCSFTASRECFSVWVEPDFEVSNFAKKFDEAYSIFEKATRLLESCGHFLDQPEGWGYFHGKQSSGKSIRSRLGYSSDGHKANKTELLKQIEDSNFFYKMSWIESTSEKGWVFHYKLKDNSDNSILPLFDFLQLSKFTDCPYFDFEECHWVYFQHENRGDSFFESNANFVHGFFGNHDKNFSQALKMLIEANSLIEPLGFSFLKK